MHRKVSEQRHSLRDLTGGIRCTYSDPTSAIRCTANDLTSDIRCATSDLTDSIHCTSRRLTGGFAAPPAIRPATIHLSSGIPCTAGDCWRH